VRYQFDFSIIHVKLPDLLAGAITTLEVSVLASCLGPPRLSLAFLRATRITALRWLVATYVELIRNTPFRPALRSLLRPALRRDKDGSLPCRGDCALAELRGVRS